MNELLRISCTLVLGCSLLAACAQANEKSNAPTNTSNSTQASGYKSSTDTNSNSSSDANSGVHGNGQLSPSTAVQANLSLVRRCMTLAQNGTAPYIPVHNQANIDSVQRAWGTVPVVSAGAGQYVTYDKQEAAFGFNKGGQIFDVRSFNSKLRNITLQDIRQALGAPGAMRHTSDSFIYLYPAGPDYQLLWVFAKDASGTLHRTVNHISVYWPEGTMNMMALNQPSPTVEIGRQISKSNSQSTFEFSIRNRPTGYSLEELEYIPKQGTAIVNTLSQAIGYSAKNAQIPSYFQADANGTTLRFTYPTSKRGEEGFIKVIYQTTSGAAIIGQSNTFFLP